MACRKDAVHEAEKHKNKGESWSASGAQERQGLEGNQLLISPCQAASSLLSADYVFFFFFFPPVVLFPVYASL